MKKKGKFSPTKFSGIFQGVVYRGTCVWGMLGNKREDRGKKNFRGARNFRGGIFGEMPKKGWKNFLVVPKSGGNFFGGHNNLLGENFS